MISDLTNTGLQAEDWGNKAARISQASALGLAVPAGLCIQYTTALQSSASASEALSAWLMLHQPRFVAVRTSSVKEDRIDASNAGRTTSMLNCTPDVTSLLKVLNEDILPNASYWTDQAGGLSFMFQYQIEALFGGVAFLIDDCLVIEAQQQSTNAITAGDEPAIRMEMRGSNLRTQGALQGWPVITLVRSLQVACSKLQAHFGIDVDVEWAWSQGVLYILQVRPVTTQL